MSRASSPPPPPEPITDGYRRSLPFALPFISPQLAALHATRSRLADLGQDGDGGVKDSSRLPLNSGVSYSCSRCGTLSLLANGSAFSGPLRSKSTSTKVSGSSASTASVKKCSVCGHISKASSKKLTVMASASAAGPTYPSVRARKRKRAELGPLVLPSVEVDLPDEDSRLETPATSSGAITPMELDIPANSKESTPLPPPSQKSSPSSNLTKPTPTAPASSSSSSTSKSRAKKKGGLQEMLARNRSQKEKEKADAEGKKGSGLAGFLVGL